MKFKELVEARKRPLPPKKDNSRFKKPPTPIKPKIKKQKCRVAPLIVAMHPDILDLPPPIFSNNYEDQLKVIYSRLNNLKNDLQNLLKN